MSCWKQTVTTVGERAFIAFNRRLVAGHKMTWLFHDLSGCYCFYVFLVNKIKKTKIGNIDIYVIDQKFMKLERCCWSKMSCATVVVLCILSE